MSMSYPNTLDQRRINNSNGKILLQNWVEERAVQEYDQVPEEYLKGDKPIIKYFKNGHQGLLTLDDRKQNPSTYTEDYVRKSRDNIEAKGARYRAIEKEARGQVLEEMNAEEERQRKLLEGDEETRYTSEAKEKFAVPGFVHRVPEPKAKHDLYSEMPVSYWTDNRKKVHGVTQFKSLDSPFRKNAAFSTPVAHSYENARPGELERYPFMSQSTQNNAAIF